MGKYQMIYPLYCILLTVSASGIPTGLARLVASHPNANAEKSAFSLYAVLGFLLSLLMALSAPLLATFMGESGLSAPCRLLAPSVFFVSILAIIRGSFQGRGNMLPTAISEICEQVVKVGLGTYFVFRFQSQPQKALTYAMAAVTVSEFVATVILLAWYKKSHPPKPLYALASLPYKSILAYTLPLTAMAIALPLSQFLESAVAVRLLKIQTQNATAQFGLYSGGAVTIVNLPVSVTYGLAAASVPLIAPLCAQGKAQQAMQKVKRSILITFLVSFPAALAIYFGAPIAVRLIFQALSLQQQELLTSLVRGLAPCAVTLSLVQTTSACLTSLGHPNKAATTGWIAAVLRVAITALTIGVLGFSVQGAVISANCSNLIAVLLNIWYIIRVGGNYENHTHRLRRSARRPVL